MQQDGTISAVMPASAPPEADRAAELKRNAEALFSQPKQWKKAVKMLEESAALRSPNDPEAYTCLLIAGRIRAGLGDMRGARAALEKAAEQALARGAVLDAANAYIDAAHAAIAQKDAAGARSLIEAAQLLSGSPMLTVSQRSRLLARIQA